MAIQTVIQHSMSTKRIGSIWKSMIALAVAAIAGIQANAGTLEVQYRQYWGVFLFYLKPFRLLRCLSSCRQRCRSGVSPR